MNIYLLLLVKVLGFCPELRAEVSVLTWAHLNQSWAELVSGPASGQVFIASPA